MSSSGADSSRKPLKTLIVKKDAKYPNIFRLVFQEGGRVPDNLTGMYNSLIEAQKAIDYYNEGYTRKKIYPRAPSNDKPQRSVSKDGEAKDTGRVQ